jgi:hypothetical protein
MLRPQRRNALAAMIGTVVLIAGAGLTAVAAAEVGSEPTNVGMLTMSPGRFAASLAMMAGLLGAVSGARALIRGKARRQALVAVVLSPMGLLVGGLVAATADGGVGTGKGFGGAVVAMVIGLIGTVLGGAALARSRRTAPPARAVSA